MKFLFITPNQQSVPLAFRVSTEGHQSSYAIEFSNDIAIPDVCVLDDPSSGAIADVLKEQGVKVAFSSRWSSLLKSSPSYNRTALTGFGFKPWDGSPGIPVTVEGWFNGDKFIASLLAFMYPKLLSGDLGPDVGCMGSVVYGKFNRCKLHDMTLGAIEKPLRKVSYRGPVSIDLMVSQDGFCAIKLYAAPRAGLLQPVLASTKRPISDILIGLATGDKVSSLDLDYWTISVGISIPPFPYVGEPRKVVIDGLNELNDKHFWLNEETTTGMLGYVTSRGKSVREARRRIYRTITKVNVSDIQYRVDIGKDIEQQVGKLYSWKWCNGINFYDGGNNGTHYGGMELVGSKQGTVSTSGTEYHRSSKCNSQTDTHA